MNLFKNLLLSFFTFLLSIVLLEVALSFFYSFPNGYYVATPNTDFVWPKDSIKKGIDNDSHVIFDKFAARTTTEYSNNKKSIITIGGSTTACYSLDQSKMWSAILQEKLGDQYWVANFGKPGTYSDHHILQLEQIDQYEEIHKIDQIIVMMGMNDISASLSKPDKYLYATPFEKSIFAFTHLPDSALPWHRTLALTKLYKRTKQNLKRFSRSKSHGEELQECNRRREKSKRVDVLPDLTKELLHYEENAMKIIQFAQSKNIDIVFVSQAVLWDKGLSEADSKLVCSYVIEKDIHYSLEALEFGMEKFNKRLEVVCKRENIPFIWNNIESNSNYFFDDCHYTELGSQVVAENIYKGLQEN